jgi:regulator of sigma E protease
MTGLIMAAQLILGLSILVVLHELGHYLAARAFGIKVEKFYLFFDAWGFKLFSFKKGDTEYGVGWLPLGGYVKISGMVDESMDKEQMAAPPQPWEFRSKPAWQRLVVMVAGVTMNVLLGILIFAYTLYQYKGEYLPNSEVKNGIYAYELGKELGLENGDKIIAINGDEFERFETLLSSKVMFGATLTVLRNDQTIEVIIPGDFYRRISASGRWNFIGAGELTYTIKDVIPDQPAQKAGFNKGDLIVAINGKDVDSGNNLVKTLSTNKSKSVDITVLRNDKHITLNTDVTDKGTIGISFETSAKINPDYRLKKYSAASALKFGTHDAFEALVSNVKGLKQIFTGKEKATDAVQGPIGIAQIYGGTWDWAWFWRITGLLSMVLAFMNMLPIPALDGGHVVFLTIEAITRRKFSDNFMEKSQVVGMVMLLALMAFAVGNDVWKHVIN